MRQLTLQQANAIIESALAHAKSERDKPTAVGAASRALAQRATSRCCKPCQLRQMP